MLTAALPTAADLLSPLSAYLHTLDPWVVRFTPALGVRWYGLSYIAGFFLAYLLFRWLARRGATLVPADRVADAMLWLIGGVLVGGRLGYVFFYSPHLLWSFSSRAPWWGVLAINEGGMAFHGGLLGVIFAAWRISRGWRVQDDTGRTLTLGRAPFLHVTDTLALIAPVGLMFGRIANFINGELLGRIVAQPGQPGPWWSVRFPQELRDWAGPTTPAGHAPPLTPEQHAQFMDLLHRAAPGEPFFRAVDTLIARSAEFATELRPILAARHPSQLYQAAAEGLLLGAVVWIAAARPRRPGVVGAWFLITYGVARIITEVFRLPDVGLAVQRPLGLSRGQWLSAGMVVLGITVLVIVARRGGERLGGYLRRQPA